MGPGGVLKGEGGGEGRGGGKGESGKKPQLKEERGESRLLVC